MNAGAKHAPGQVSQVEGRSDVNVWCWTFADLPR